MTSPGGPGAPPPPPPPPPPRGRGGREKAGGGGPLARYRMPDGSLLRGLDIRKRDLDQRALLAAALDRKFGLVGFDQRLGQRQAETGPAFGPALADLAEWRERETDFILVHANAGVADADHRLARSVDSGRDDHLSAGLVE